MKIAFCFDLDGTLTKEEILPQIAKHVGLYEEIDLLTNITMDGLITFDKSFKLRTKLLSTVPISVVKKTIETISIDPELKTFVNQNKQNSFIITGNLNVWINDFIDKNFGCQYYSSKALYDNDQLLGIDHILLKNSAIDELKTKYDKIVAIGDGMNDCSMFENADIGIAYGGVHQPVSSLIKVSNYICYNSRSLVNLLNSLNNQYK